MGELEPTLLLYRQEPEFTHDPGWLSESSVLGETCSGSDEITRNVGYSECTNLLTAEHPRYS
jgi:hypothetical protein